MQDKQNPAKYYLKGYKALMLRRESLLREIERLRESLTGITAPLKDDPVQGSGASDRMADTVARIVDAEEALNPALTEINDRIRGILAAIDSVPDEMEKTVLTLRYIEGLDWITISERIAYEISNTYIIHGRALVEVNRWMREKENLAIQTECHQQNASR